MREGRYYRIEHTCAHTHSYWFDRDDHASLASLEASLCTTCQRQEREMWREWRTDRLSSVLAAQEDI